MKPDVTVKMKFLEFIYLRTAVQAQARKPCRKSNCGTVCLCDSCAARRVLPRIEEADQTVLDTLRGVVRP